MGRKGRTSKKILTAIPKFSSRQYSDLSVSPNFRFLMQNTLSDNWAAGYNLGMEWDGQSTIPTYLYIRSRFYNHENGQVILKYLVL